MRIAVYHNLPSGGAKRALVEIVRRLIARHSIDVFTLESADHDFCDLRPYCEKHVIFPFAPWPLAKRPFGRLNQGIRTIDLYRLQKSQRKVAAAIDAGKYDVVFVHHCQFTQAPGVLQYLQTPSVYFCQEPPRKMYETAVARSYEQFTPLQRLGNKLDPLPGIYRRALINIDRENTLKSTRLLVNSRYSAERIEHIYGMPTDLLYLGVAADKFDDLQLPRTTEVVSVGALTPRKGFDFLIRSLALIAAEERPLLHIVYNSADPREKEFLQRLAADLEVAVIWHHKISDTALVELYNRAALTLYAPVMEPFGFVPLESMACGTPVVGVCEAGVRETIVHEQTGLLIERDEAEFATAVTTLLQNPTLRNQYGQQGKKNVVTTWAWKNTVKTLEAYLVETPVNVKRDAYEYEFIPTN